MADKPMTVEEYKAAQQKEWGTYVALVPIDILGGRAFNPGDPVPVSHVEQKIVDEASVAKVTTKAAAVVLDPDNTEGK